jgi:hypothetical protein
VVFGVGQSGRRCLLVLSNVMSSSAAGVAAAAVVVDVVVDIGKMPKPLV